MDARFARSFKLICRAAVALDAVLGRFSVCARHARAAKGLHAGCLSALRRRNSERPLHYGLPAPEQAELERRLPGGIRAVGKLTPPGASNCKAVSFQLHRIDIIEGCEFVRSKSLSAVQILVL
jgi:hypothetical protein